MLPMMLTVFAPSVYDGASEDELLDGYQRMTGQKAPTSVAVWPLTGIYTPYTGGFVDPDSGQTITYGYSSDNWLYGTEVKSYTPTQYTSTTQEYTVYKDDSGVFRYYIDSKDYNKDYGTGHKGLYGKATQEDVDEGRAEHVGDIFKRDDFKGDLYTEVNFDINQKSDIFFVESSKKEDAAGHFLYDYNGYRMAFTPISNYTTLNADGEKVPIVSSSTSLSLIWYQYLNGQSGISGQITLVGSSGGVAYINAAQILSQFNNNNSTAAFDMVFNGVPMTIIIKIDPMATSAGMTVEQAYNAGRWSVMVTSQSVESNAYTGTDNAINPMSLFETMIDLLTFNLDDYNMAPWMSTLCGIIFVVPLYLGIIVLCMDNYPVLILVGIIAAIQALVAAFPSLPF